MGDSSMCLFEFLLLVDRLSFGLRTLFFQKIVQRRDDAFHHVYSIFFLVGWDQCFQ